jgi:hypothetical protein
VAKVCLVLHRLPHLSEPGAHPFEDTPRRARAGAVDSMHCVKGSSRVHFHESLRLSVMGATAPKFRLRPVQNADCSHARGGQMSAAKPPRPESACGFRTRDVASMRAKMGGGSCLEVSAPGIVATAVTRVRSGAYRCDVAKPLPSDASGRDDDHAAAKRPSALTPAPCFNCDELLFARNFHASGV